MKGQSIIKHMNIVDDLLVNKPIQLNINCCNNKSCGRCLPRVTKYDVTYV